MKLTWTLLAFTLMLLLSASATAQEFTGVWKTIDDETGDAETLVELYEQDGKLYGKFIKLIKQPKKKPICERCPGEDKNQPLVGLVFIKGLEKDGDKYRGKILNPKDGKFYKCYLQLQGDGELKVRGYLGISLLGRTQIWQRHS